MILTDYGEATGGSWGERSEHDGFVGLMVGVGVGFWFGGGWGGVHGGFIYNGFPVVSKTSREKVESRNAHVEFKSKSKMTE